MRIGQHSAKVIFFASADAWIQAKPLIKLMELKNISTTFRRAQPENKSKLRDLINATGRVLCEKLVPQGGTQEFTPKKTISAPGIAHVGGMNSSGNWGYRQFVLSGMQRFARREAPMLNVKTAHRLRLCIDCHSAFPVYHGAPSRHICRAVRHGQRNRPSAGERD